uniref:Uncharacterized protein n=1 Tax=Oryza sativa subsp. japonica TaxID=39947 RepID=Q6ETX7_ORYSJ|nr:hypothetical protein [Oryza sativa Japonica Group]
MVSPPVLTLDYYFNYDGMCRMLNDGLDGRRKNWIVMIEDINAEEQDINAEEQ